MYEIICFSHYAVRSGEKAMEERLPDRAFHGPMAVAMQYKLPAKDIVPIIKSAPKDSLAVSREFLLNEERAQMR